jgi:peptide/nickel transport system substrate-binding protein
MTTMRVLFLLTLFLYSCSDSENSSQFKRNDNSVIIRLEADPDQLNPVLKTNAYSAQVLDGIFSFLLSVDPYTFELLPQVAKALPIIKENENGLSYTFEIHESAVWDNGDPITADDFVFSLKCVLHPSVPAQHLRPYLNFIRDVEIDSGNPKKFTVITDDTYMLGAAAIGNSVQILPEYIYDPQGLLRNIPIKVFCNEDAINSALEVIPELKKFAEDFGGSKYSADPAFIVGSGPYKITSINPGQEITLQKKENWWGDQLKDKYPSLRAFPEKLIYKIILDNSTAIAALKSEDIDVLTKIDPANFKDLLQTDFLSKSYNFETPLSMVYYFLAFNTTHPSLSSRNIRQAIAYSIDVDEVIEKLYDGYAQRTVSPMLPTAKYYNSNIEPYKFNPNKAKELLKNEGWEDTDNNGIVDKIVMGKKEELSIKLAIPANSENARNIGLLFQDNAKMAGINLILEAKEGSVLLADWRQKNYEITISGSTISAFSWDPKQRYHTEGDNRTGFGNPYTDGLIDELRTTKDEDKRFKNYQEIQQIMHDEVAHLYLFVPTERIAIHKRFDPVPSPLAPGYVTGLLKLKDE